MPGVGWDGGSDGGGAPPWGISFKGGGAPPWPGGTAKMKTEEYDYDYSYYYKTEEYYFYYYSYYYYYYKTEELSVKGVAKFELLSQQYRSNIIMLNQVRKFLLILSHQFAH